MLHSKMSKTKKQKQKTNSSLSKSEIIDREFLDGMVKNYDKKTVLEFVESPKLISISKQVGADYIQGYVFGMPAPIEQYSHSLEQNKLIVPIVQKEK